MYKVFLKEKNDLTECYGSFNKDELKKVITEIAYDDIDGVISVYYGDKQENLRVDKYTTMSLIERFINKLLKLEVEPKYIKENIVISNKVNKNVYKVNLILKEIKTPVEYIFKLKIDNFKYVKNKTLNSVLHYCLSKYVINANNIEYINKLYSYCEMLNLQNEKDIEKVDLLLKEHCK